MTKPRPIRAVLDTNVVIAALKSRSPNSPTAEIIVLGREYQGIAILDGLRLLYAVRGDEALA